VHPPFDKLPPSLQKTHVLLERHFFERLDFNKGPEMMESWRAGLTKLHGASLMPDSLHSIPLFVISREDMNDDERQQQKALAHLSAHSRWEIAVGSGHFVQLERPELVIDAITNVLRGVRGSSGG
jgi:pimeloyl-ACP methyl ester carboxylesterase